MKKKIILSSLIALMPIVSCANSLFEKPSTCPDAASIKSIPLSTAIYAPNSPAFYVFSRNFFDTRFLWSFGVGLIYTDSSSEALNMGNKALMTLAGQPLPEYHSIVTLCHYQINGAMKAIAVYPASEYSEIIKYWERDH